METMLAHTGMEIIPRHDCLRLLGEQQVGRLGFLVGDQPMVLPVNYAIVDGVVLFRTGAGTKLDAVRGHKVAFEIDDIDVESNTGWSVVVQGVAQEITDTDDWFAEVQRRHAAPTWLPGAAGHLVTIAADSISGRRVPRIVPPSRYLG